MLSKNDNFYLIVTGNHVTNTEIDSLVRKIEFVNTLDKKGLQDYYRQTLAEKTQIETDNAGLGIIDIALKSGNKLEYEFKPVTKDVSFYVIQARIQL